MMSPEILPFHGWMWSAANVLIYLDAKAQRKVLPTFHYALNPTGLLMLWQRGDNGSGSGLFTVIDKLHHIYGTKSGSDAASARILRRGRCHGCAFGTPRAEAASGADLQKRLDRVIQARYSPDGVVVNGDLQILQFRGHTAPYLDPSPGEATFQPAPNGEGEPGRTACVALFKRQPKPTGSSEKREHNRIDGQQEQIATRSQRRSSPARDPSATS